MNLLVFLNVFSSLSNVVKRDENVQLLFFQTMLKLRRILGFLGVGCQFKTSAGVGGYLGDVPELPWVDRCR